MSDRLIYGYIAFEGKTPRYVGIGYKNRWKHINNSRSHNKDIKRYNKTNRFFRVGTRILGNNIQIAHQWEISHIKKYGRKDKNLGTLFNHTDGGEGNSEGGTWMRGLNRKEITKNPNWVNPNLGDVRPNITKIQKGILMKDRLNNSEWVSPKFGKKMVDYRGMDYRSPLKGISRQNANKIHNIPITLQNLDTNEIKTWDRCKDCTRETGVTLYYIKSKSNKELKGWRLISSK